MLIASLEAYDPPELRWTNDSLWRRWRTGLIDRGVDAPPSLSRNEDWNAPDLLVAQTCGLPFALDGHLQLVATPVYRAPGCDGALYRSVLVARSSEAGRPLADFGNSVVAVNSWHSHSGFTALCEALATPNLPRPFFAKALLSGSHSASAEILAQGKADIASIDCVAWELAKSAGIETVTRLAVLGWPPPAPGLPLVTSGSRPAEIVKTLRATLANALADLALGNALKTLRLVGFERLDRECYGQFCEYWSRSLRSPVVATET